MYKGNSISVSPKIIDASLREGAQAPGVAFSIEGSVEIAKLLVALPIDMVECGHPKASEHEALRVRAVVKACGDVPVLAHARAKVEDIDAVKESGAQWVGIFAGVNDISRTCRIRNASIADLVRDAIAYAKSVGLKVRFSVEDASRTPADELMDTFQTALAAGADRLCFADTVGLLCPWEVEEQVSGLVNRLKGIALEVHLHDDRGLANANALSALRAGATWVSSSVNGIGERSGITDTSLLLANLASMELRPFPDGHLMQHLSKVVQSHTRLPVDRWRPLVGANAFTHTAKLHRTATELDECAYTWVDPKLLGRVNSLEHTNFPLALDALINSPEIISATELKHHRHGPGDRYVMLDNRVVPGANQYCIVRHIPKMDDFGPGHVDCHRHNVDSLFLFIGFGRGLTGLTAEVVLGEEKFIVNSPCSVFIPSGVRHSYRAVAGEGLYLNHVLAGTYNDSLLEETAPKIAMDGTLLSARQREFTSEGDPVQPPDNAVADGAVFADIASEQEAMDFLMTYVNGRHPGALLAPDTRVDEVFDSLAYLDFFLHMEGQAGGVLSLDALSVCTTFAEIASVMANAHSHDSFDGQGA